MQVTFNHPYSVAIRAVESIHSTKDKRQYVFIIDFYEVSDKPNEDKIIFNIPSMHNYNSPEDAIQDAYGITELFGFRLTELYTKVKIPVMHWDHENKTYVTVDILFDGSDFYPTGE